MLRLKDLKPFSMQSMKQNRNNPKWMVLGAMSCLLMGVGITWVTDTGAEELKPAAATERPVNLTADQALQRLLEGNARYVAGKAAHPDQSPERRTELLKGQAPFAVVLTCADSRVAPELFFDQGLGDLFVIRNAGNILDDHVIGSMEYAVEHLHASLIIVVGHENCGAVSAAVAGGATPGHIHSVVEAILPAVEQSKALPGDRVDNAVRANALRTTQMLTHIEPILKEAAAKQSLGIVSARYDLTTGKVELLK